MQTRNSDKTGIVPSASGYRRRRVGISCTCTFDSDLHFFGLMYRHGSKPI